MKACMKRNQGCWFSAQGELPADNKHQLAINWVYLIYLVITTEQMNPQLMV